MFSAFIKAAATSLPIGVASVQNLKAGTALFGLTDAATAQLLEAAAGDLGGQPSVMGKLCFPLYDGYAVLPIVKVMGKLCSTF